MVKRTTVSADEDDLATLEREAQRRGVSLSHLLREAVMEYAAEIRAANAPRFGVAHGPGNLSEASVEDEDAPIRAADRAYDLTVDHGYKPAAAEDPERYE